MFVSALAQGATIFHFRKRNRRLRGAAWCDLAAGAAAEALPRFENERLAREKCVCGHRRAAWPGGGSFARKGLRSVELSVFSLWRLPGLPRARMVPQLTVALQFSNRLAQNPRPRSSGSGAAERHREQRPPPPASGAA